MDTFHTQDSVHNREQHNNSLSQTLQCNRISSLFSHITNSKVLLVPLIHYHIDYNSTSVVFDNIHFSVVFDIQHRLLSISYTSALREVWLQTDKLLDPPPGTPLWRANIPSRYCPGNGSGHLLWPEYKRNIITNVTLKHMYFPDRHIYIVILWHNKYIGANKCTHKFFLENHVWGRCPAGKGMRVVIRG